MNWTAIRAVLFDFDGTLADSYGAIAATINDIRTFHRLPPLSVAEVRVHVGLGAENLILNTVPGSDVQRDLRRYREHHPTVIRKETHLLPGAMETLVAVKRSGRRVAICSNKPRVYTVELVEFLGLAPHVDHVFGPEDVARLKPAPDMLLKALEFLKLKPEDALYIGDMTVDIQTARAAGVRVWCVPTGSDTREALEAAKPDRLLRDLHELILAVSRETASGPLA